MRQTACALAIALTAAAAVAAQDATAPVAAGPFDVRDAISGVWALDPRDIVDPGDFSCDQRPLVLQLTHEGRGIASMRAGDDGFVQGAIIDVRNDFPEGPAMTILWADAPDREDGKPDTLVLFMPEPDKFNYIRSSDMMRSQESGDPLPVIPHARCAQAAPDDALSPLAGPSD